MGNADRDHVQDGLGLGFLAGTPASALVWAPSQVPSTASTSVAMATLTIAFAPFN